MESEGCESKFVAQVAHHRCFPHTSFGRARYTVFPVASEGSIANEVTRPLAVGDPPLPPKFD